MSAATDIAAAAADHGWTVHFDNGVGVTEYRKGRRHVMVNVNVRGAVVQASHPGGNILGSGKAARVIAIIREGN